MFFLFPVVFARGGGGGGEGDGNGWSQGWFWEAWGLQGLGFYGL